MAPNRVVCRMSNTLAKWLVKEDSKKTHQMFHMLLTQFIDDGDDDASSVLKYDN